MKDKLRNLRNRLADSSLLYLIESVGCLVLRVVLQHYLIATMNGIILKLDTLLKEGIFCSIQIQNTVTERILTHAQVFLVPC